MATSYKDLNPKAAIVAAGTLVAKPGKANELAQWFANLKARADSDIEPGTLRYHIVRNGDLFAVWEEYANAEALELHVEQNELFKEFIALELFELTKSAFYSGNSLPVPTKSF
ncbi:hypothetical protein EW145_g5858 [Phellinidium pouzarii]|uniref:ABM domain-containing protein n=1 Tax=Phellinidium pouzarii TaxID=167371 RepID=A0A4S4KYI1_9AGAM|nr:hypothetical protein EW145_g5858 [Phellinidium pouzarii]